MIALAAGLACDTGGDAAETVREITGNVATVIDETQPKPVEPTPTSLHPSSGVSAVMSALDGLVIAERGSGFEYDRRDWRHWIDADKDCQDTRAEVLILESAGTVSFATENRCRVVSGEWIGPWSGEVFVDASDVDVDHHVPLGHAHISGGWKWDDDRKRAYANDLKNPNSLQATSASVNRSKGKKPPDEWKPENPASWCRYAADWISVKQQWELTIGSGEKRALADMLTTCDDVGSWGFEGEKSE